MPFKWRQVISTLARLGLLCFGTLRFVVYSYWLAPKKAWTPSFSQTHMIHFTSDSGLFAFSLRHSFKNRRHLLFHLNFENIAPDDSRFVVHPRRPSSKDHAFKKHLISIQRRLSEPCFSRFCIKEERVSELSWIWLCGKLWTNKAGPEIVVACADSVVMNHAEWGQFKCSTCTNLLCCMRWTTYVDVNSVSGS